MKILFLVRHAKSSWELPVEDKERPLKSRGLKDAQIVAKRFLELENFPKKIYTSPAKRALETCKIFMNLSKNEDLDMSIIDDLYDFNGNSVIEFLKNLSNSFDSVMIFGHNHAFTSISNIFGDRYIENLPTSGLVKIIFDTNVWSDITNGQTEFIISPKNLR